MSAVPEHFARLCAEMDAAHAAEYAPRHAPGGHAMMHAQAHRFARASKREAARAAALLARCHNLADCEAARTDAVLLARRRATQRAWLDLSSVARRAIQPPIQPTAGNATPE